MTLGGIIPDGTSLSVLMPRVSADAKVGEVELVMTRGDAEQW
jgi:hypothetical protein